MKRFILALILIFSVLICGCNREVSPPPDSPNLVDVFVDVSDPTPDVVERNLEAAYSLQVRLPKGTLVRFYTFAKEVQRVCEGPPIRSLDEFRMSVSEPTLLRLKTDPREVDTHTEKVFEIGASNAVDRESYALYIASDGGFDDWSKPVIDLLHRSIASLAENVAVAQVVIIGVHARHQLRWARWLEPLGGAAFIRGVTADAKVPNYWEVTK